MKLKVNSKDDLYIVGGGLSAKYKLKEIHFHWQSEHTMDGKRYGVLRLIKNLYFLKKFE